MSLIEGVGDEVIEFFIGVLFVIIGIVAWWSTRIVDRPIIRTVVVFERRSQNQNNQLSTVNASGDRRLEADQRNYVEELTTQSTPSEPEQGNKPPAAGTSVEPNATSSERRDLAERRRSSTDEQNEIVEAMDFETSVLRRRRLEFFDNRQEHSSTNPVNTDLDNNLTSINTDEAPLTNENMNQDEEPQHDTTESTSNATSSVDEDDIRIKLKYINDDLRLVNGKLQEQLGDFKRRHFELELASDKLVRLIFNGQVLQRDDLTLQSCGLFDNCVVHCLVHQKRPSPTERSGSNSGLGADNSASSGRSRRARAHARSTAHQQTRDWDLGNLFFAIVSFILGAAWYFRYEYAQLYTVTATVALVGLTGIFTVLLVGMYFPDPDPPVPPVRS